MTTVITVANQKGGVGKSTTVVCLAHGLALKGKRILAVDLDPQGQLATLLGLRQESCVFSLLIAEDTPAELVRDSGRPGLFLLPGDKRTRTAEAVAAAEHRPIGYFREAIAPLLASRFDYVVCDTSPSVGDLQAAALWSSDLVLIPSACDFLSVEGSLKLSGTLQTVKSQYGWSGRLAGVLPTFYDGQTKESQTVLADLKAKYPGGVLDAIHRAVILRECAAFGQTVFEVDKTSRAAREYQQLVDYVLKITK